MLDRLLTIKRQREGAATSRLVEAQRKCDRRRLDRQAQEQKLSDYGAWRQQEEARLYEAVHRQELSRYRLESYRQRIAVMRSRELQLESDLAGSRHAVEAAEAELADARKRRIDARREVVRFEEYMSHLSQVEKLSAERGEETETEESVSARFRAEPGSSI